MAAARLACALALLAAVGGRQSCDTSFDCPGSETCEVGECKFSCHHDIEGRLSAKIMPGTIIGTLIGIGLVIYMSLPICCGVCIKNLKNHKIAGLVVGLLGGLIILVPAIAGSRGANLAVDELCDECGPCKEQERDDYKDDIAALGVVYAYLTGGVSCIALGVAAIFLGACGCCPCCGSSSKLGEQGNGGAAPPIVVGQSAYVDESQKGSS